MMATHDPSPTVEMIDSPFATAESATFTRISCTVGSVTLGGVTLGSVTGDGKYARADRPRRRGSESGPATSRPCRARENRLVPARRETAGTASPASVGRSRSAHYDR